MKNKFNIDYLKASKVLIETDKGKRYMKVTNWVTQKKGEIYYGDASLNIAKLAQGTDGHYLTLSSGIPEDIPLPKNMDLAEQIVKFAKGKRKGFTKELVDQWNKGLEFDLHSKLKTYGFMGAKRLNMIFKIS